MAEKQISVLDYIEISNPSSKDLKKNVSNILKNSKTYSAAVASLDNSTGTYKIILQGTLKPEQFSNQAIRA